MLTMNDTQAPDHEGAPWFKWTPPKARLPGLFYGLRKERPVGTFNRAIGLDQSVLAQHLALLRAESLWKPGRAAQRVFHRVADPERRLARTPLRELDCQPDGRRP